MKYVAFHNLGCKVNSYELDIMQQLLQEKGYQVVPFHEKADIYIVNTCTVTNIADRKSRQMLHQAKKRNPQAIVVAVGCYVQTHLEQSKLDEAIDLCIGNDKKKDIVEILEEYLRQRGQSPAQHPDKTLDCTTVLDLAQHKEYEEMTLQETADHTRAYIKIQDGCNQFCSYCAIPLARGRVRSRKTEDILAEITGLVQRGYKEVVLTGIHISSYGVDFEEQGVYRGQSYLIDLVEKVCAIPGLCRVRLGSLEPRIITREVVDRLSVLPNLCPHFHLSLQSGCDATLKRMNRHYTTAQFEESVQLLRQGFAEPAITTDVIVGFPGETREEFQETVAFLEKISLYEMHVFKYSKRADTVAARMEGQLTEKQKSERSEVLLSMTEEQSYRYRQKYVGRWAEILLEESKEIEGQEYLVGHTMDYVLVAVPGGKYAAGEIIQTKVQKFLNKEILLGE